MVDHRDVVARLHRLPYRLVAIEASGAGAERDEPAVDEARVYAEDRVVVEVGLSIFYLSDGGSSPQTDTAHGAEAVGGRGAPLL